MFLQRILLIGFKNYEQAEATFSPKFNCFTGNNGMGKTNMLDAIYYLSFCKSYFNPIDSQNIQNNAPFYLIQGKYLINDEENEVYCGFKRNEKKQFKLNKKEYQKLSEHIGLLPLVMISPEDADLISGGSELRRKFIDGVISQYNKNYLEELLSYNRTLLQRNALLKSFAERNNFDKHAIAIYDEQLAHSGTFIYGEREAFFNRFNTIFNTYYHQLSDNQEEEKINYHSHLKESKIKDLLTQNRDKDRAAQYTTVGIHKDDLEFEINNRPVKKFASQGQQKSFLIALKLAQFEFIKSIKNVKPILLLDDINDKLDEKRLMRLMNIVATDDFGQVFITDTHKERMEAILLTMHTECSFFSIENGNITKH